MARSKEQVRSVDKHHTAWHFDEDRLVIRNATTGTRVDLRQLDTSRAVLAHVLRIGLSESRDHACDFTTALRHACTVVFGRSLRDVYCNGGRQMRVDWEKRRTLP